MNEPTSNNASLRRVAALWTAVAALANVTACGGGGGGASVPNVEVQAANSGTSLSGRNGGGGGGGGGSGGGGSTGTPTPSPPSPTPPPGPPSPTPPPANPPVTQTTVSFTNSANLLLGNNTLYRSTYTAANKPAVLMMHGCAGAGSSLYDDWGSKLAKLGYAVLLVDSFTPRGAGNQCGNGDTGVSEVYDRPLDALAGYDYLVNNVGVSSGRVVLLGWSHGASSTLATLWEGQTRKPFVGGVVFYAGCGLYNHITKPYPYAPLYMHHGTDDQTTLLSSCTTLIGHEAADKGTSRKISMTTYNAAGHSFDNAKEACVGATCTYGTASGRTLTVDDWNAKLAADPVALQKLLELTGN